MTSSSKPTQSVLLFSGGYDHSIKLWDPTTGMCVKSLKVSDSQVNALAISPDKKLLAAATNPFLRIFDLGRGEVCIAQSDHATGHSGNITCVGFDAEGKWIFTGGEDGTVRIFDPRITSFNGVCMHQRLFTFNEKRKTPAEGGTATSAAGAAATEKESNVGGVEDQKKKAVNATALHPNQAELVVGDQGGRVAVYDLSSSLADAPNDAAMSFIPEPEVAVRAISISADGRRVFIATDSGKIFLWSPTSPSSLLSGGDLQPHSRSVRLFAQAHDTYVLKIQVSPNMNYLATCSADHTVKLFSLDPPPAQLSSAASEAPLAKATRTFAKHQRWVWDLQFSKDSTYLVTVSSDHSVRLYDVTNGELVRNFVGHSKAVVCVALSD